MPWLVDYLAAFFYSFPDWGKFILLAVFLAGFMLLILDLWASSAAKKKSPEDKAILKIIEIIEEGFEKVGGLYGRLRDGYVHYWHNWGSEGLSDQQIILQKRLVDAGLDLILELCIIHSPNDSLVNRKPKFSQIKRVAAAWAGYIKDIRGPEAYRWIVELKNGRYMYLRGFFDPSGFESRTGLWIRVADTAEKAALFEIRLKTLQRMNKDQDVYDAAEDLTKNE